MITNTRVTFGTAALFVLCILTFNTFALYDVPNNDADCPANCRQIPWKAGSDVWSNGTLPVYPATACTGLTEGDGTTDNRVAIQNAIDRAGANTAVAIPEGIYYVNGTITLKSNVVLRGAGAGPPYLPAASSGTTTLKFGPNGRISMEGLSKGSEVSVTGGYEKGSTSITVGAGHGLVSGDWVVLFEAPDPAIPVVQTGAEGDCSWCGESNGTYHLMSQIMQVTVSGNTLALSRPLYYTFKSSLTPGLKKINFGIRYGGVENMKLNGWSTARTRPHLRFSGALFCWVKNVETYNTPDAAKAFPIYMEHSYGNEIRDSYFHYGQGNGGDRNYGIGLFFSTSDNKIENNIFRENRHSIVQEGGGSGNVFLYNYIDDNYSENATALGNTAGNHGPHPYMTLYEGNIVSHMVVDDVWGSSSHGLFFRNWLWGDETGDFTGFTTTNPGWGFAALELWNQQVYYSVVGNVLGIPGLHTNWANADLFTAGCDQSLSRNKPSVYVFGCDYGSTYSAAVWNTTIKHGNYDYKTNGVAHWDGGSDHALKMSMYYGAKPVFFADVPWPPIGPDVTGIHNDIPAKVRYDNRATNIAAETPVSAIQGFAMKISSVNPLKIEYQLPEAGFVNVAIYSAAGKQAASLVNDMKDGGNYSVTCATQNLASGVYFCKVTAGTMTAVRAFSRM